jgi:putative intracellular protease/amidase
MTGTPFRIVFAVYPGMTHLDFTGPHQFLSRTPDSQTIVASAAGGAIEADGLTFANTICLASVEACDLICVPGGLAATKIAQDAVFIGELKRLAAGAKYITSVCTGSLILASRRSSSSGGDSDGISLARPVLLRRLLWRELLLALPPVSWPLVLPPQCVALLLRQRMPSCE